MKKKLIVTLKFTDDEPFKAGHGEIIGAFTKAHELSNIRDELQELGYDAEFETVTGRRLITGGAKHRFYSWAMVSKYMMVHTLTVYTTLRAKTFGKARKILDDAEYQYYFEQ